MENLRTKFKDNTNRSTYGSKKKIFAYFFSQYLENVSKVGLISYRNYLLGFINILFGRYYNIPFYVFILFSLLSSYNMCKFSVRNARLCGGY